MSRRRRHESNTRGTRLWSAMSGSAAPGHGPATVTTGGPAAGSRRGPVIAGLRRAGIATATPGGMRLAAGSRSMARPDGRPPPSRRHSFAESRGGTRRRPERDRRRCRRGTFGPISRARSRRRNIVRSHAAPRVSARHGRRRHRCAPPPRCRPQRTRRRRRPRSTVARRPTAAAATGAMVSVRAARGATITELLTAPGVTRGWRRAG